jgi:hypothetical protein
MYQIKKVPFVVEFEDRSQSLQDTDNMKISLPNFLSPVV